jgi:hypothetical protein
LTIEDALKQALSSLSNLKIGADPNLEDICHIAQTFKDFFNLQFNNKKTSKEKVVEIVEIVEENFLRSVAIRPVYRNNIFIGKDAIRVKSEQQILNEFKAIVNEISKRQLDFGSFEEIITKALFFWYGCLCMDKTCRKEDIEGNPIKYKLEIYDYLKNNSNPCIYYGFVSANKFRKTPDQLKLKDYSWIPKESPYWKDDI